jgi:hypothetical protein
MGLGSSRPSSMSTPILRVAPVTREQLLRSSNNSRLMINDMFNTMISKITPTDILKLANPAKCTDYVFAMAETLDSLFKGLKIQPRTDKTTGVIVFQKGDDLKKDTNETRKLCLQIAYFYIRIFQIFGALALTVVDDPGSSSVLDAIQQQRRGPKAIPGRGFQPAFVGGGEKLGNYLPLIPLQSSDSDIPQSLKNKDYNIFLIDHNEVDDNRKLFYFTKKTKENQSYNLLRNYDDYYNLKAKVSINSDYFSSIGNSTSNGNAIFTMENYNVEFKFPVDNKIVQSINKEINKKRDYKLIKDGGDWYVLDDKGNPHIFKNAIPYLFNKKNLQIMKILKEGKTVKGTEYKYDQQRQKQDTLQLTRFESGALQTDYIRKTLESFSSTSTSSQSKALNFCTARALQLLDATKIPTPTGIKITATSDICKTKLDAAPSSLPNPTASTVPGLKAFEQLYHTKMDVKDKSFILDAPPTTDEEYANFLKTITELFGKPTQKAVSSMAQIPAADAPRICASYVGKQLQISDPKTINETINIINRMFGRQLAHTRNVIDFLRRYLLTFTPNKRTGTVEFNLNPRIIMLGINEINQVGKMARQLLLNYYKDCETGYKQGIDIISKSSTIKPVA